MDFVFFPKFYSQILLLLEAKDKAKYYIMCCNEYFKINN